MFQLTVYTSLVDSVENVQSLLIYCFVNYLKIFSWTNSRLRRKAKHLTQTAAMAATSVSQETEKKIMRFQIESTTNLGNQIKMKTNQQIHSRYNKTQETNK